MPGPARIPAPAAFVAEARTLSTHLATLRELLSLQRDEMLRLEDRLLQGGNPGGTAARRLRAVTGAAPRR